MTTAATVSRDNPEALFAMPAIVADRRPDGSILLKSTAPLGEYARCVGDWLERWARETPERIFLGERPVLTGRGRRSPTRTRCGGFARSRPG